MNLNSFVKQCLVFETAFPIYKGVMSGSNGHFVQLTFVWTLDVLVGQAAEVVVIIYSDREKS